MPRAKSLITATLCAAAILLVSAPASAQNADYIDGVGLIDYRQRPNLDIGSWVKYHVTSKSEGGAQDDYFVTLLVAGEERFWDEDCFWMETWLSKGKAGEQPIASLISYRLFDDPEPYVYAKYYARKSISDISDGGGLEATIMKFPVKALQSRNELRPEWSFDTLGTETIEGKAGTFDVIKYKVLRAGEATRTGRDSTSTTRVNNERIDYWSKDIPITGLVRQEIRLEAERITTPIWAGKHEGNVVKDVSIGVAELIEYGKSGKEPLLVDEAHRKSIKEQEREKKRKRES